MTWAVWLAALVPSLVGRVLAALGFAVVTIAGLDVIGDQAVSYITTAHAGIPSDVLAIMNLAGFGGALNIFLGFLAARLSLYVTTSAARILGVT